MRSWSNGTQTHTSIQIKLFISPILFISIPSLWKRRSSSSHSPGILRGATFGFIGFWCFFLAGRELVCFSRDKNPWQIGPDSSVDCRRELCDAACVNTIGKQADKAWQDGGEQREEEKDGNRNKQIYWRKNKNKNYKLYASRTVYHRSIVIAECLHKWNPEMGISFRILPVPFSTSLLALIKTTHVEYLLSLFDVRRFCIPTRTKYRVGCQMHNRAEPHASLRWNFLN